MPNYTYANLKSSVNAAIHNKVAILADPRVTINDAVLDAWSTLDIRSAKRKSSLAPNLFNDVFEYAWPTDGKNQKVIGLQAQTQVRSREGEWVLTTEEEFDRDKSSRKNLLAFADRSFSRQLLVSADIDDLSLTVSELDSLTASGGTWSAFGQATNLVADTYDFVKGNGSIKWDIGAGVGTTAGIENTGLNTFDLTEYKSYGSAFAWIKITSTTNLTNFKLRIGSSSADYYEMTATTKHDGTAFVTGWNLIRFDFSGKTTTGTPDDDACDYAALYMTKDSAKVSETDYRFDWLVVKRGLIHNLIYYSKYPWQTSGGTWIEKSTADTDYLNVDSDEYSIILAKTIEYAANEAREDADARKAEKRFGDKVGIYRTNYKSEALPLINTSYYF